MALRRDNVEPFPPPRSERPIADLFADLARDASMLVRQEVALAKAEIAQGLAGMGVGAAMIVAGGMVALMGVGFLLLAAVYALSLVVEPWLAALIVGGTVIVLGAGLAFLGKSKLGAQSLVPTRTLRTLKDDATWAKEQAQ
jgi:hypothetical protein